MRILMVSSEVEPFSKTGGLADVVGSLPFSLEKLGVEVNIFSPAYRCVLQGGFGLRKMEIPLCVPISTRRDTAEVLWTTIGKNIKCFFLRKDKYYDRDHLYGTNDGDYEDNAARFTFLCRAVPEFIKKYNLQFDIIHCHDWQTGLIPVYLKTIYKEDPQFKNTATLFTIHNLGYQGIFWHYDLHLTGLDWDIFHPRGIEFYGKINFLKGGLYFSDILTTVSKKYAEEIQTPEFGFGLDGVLRDRKKDLFGITNGVNYDNWNPETDPYIVARYNENSLENKKRCKEDLQRVCGLPVRDNVPLIGSISRLADQKGFDLIRDCFDKIMEMGVQYILLGRGDRRYEESFMSLSRKYPESFAFKNAYDNVLAHKIEAGCDLFLMPSRYEPCGLNQIYSLKYGTIPVVRATGGLDDTIDDYTSDNEKGTGFKFSTYTKEALLDALRRATETFQDPVRWRELMIRAMRKDFSWDVAAQKYIELYRIALSREEDS